MTRVDRAIVSLLVAVLAIAVLVTAASTPATPATAGAGESPSPSLSASPEPSPADLAVYREGIVGRATSVTPLTATTMVDRELVSLVFSGLVRLGKGGALLPDLAESWSVDKTGGTWTFRIRSGATWQDGVPVTAADVVFTVKSLQDPAYDGPDAASWREVSVTQVTPRTVRFKLTTPLGGFLQELTQPLLPEHLLADIPVDALADSAFARQPVGSGPYRLVSLTDKGADLVPDSGVISGGIGGTVGQGAAPEATPGATADPSAAAVGSPPPTPDPSAVAGSPVASGAASTAAPGNAQSSSGFDRLEFHFFADAASLEAAYQAGGLDAAVGLSAADAASLGSTPGSRLVRYPLATVTAIVMNERAGEPFRDATLRRALVQVVSRPALITTVVGGLAVEARGLIPPSSWAFDRSASTPVAFDRTAAARALRKAGWTKIGKWWAQPGSKSALKIPVISVNTASSPIVRRTAAAVVDSWKTFGFKVSFQTLAPADVATHLQSGSFSVAILDVNVGLDPDLYPLLASSQATSKGSNVLGLQDQALDAKLTAARAPGSLAARKKAYSQLQAFLAQAQYMPALFFRDEPVVLSNRVVGPAPNLLGGPGDRFWDVLTWRLASSR